MPDHELVGVDDYHAMAGIFCGQCIEWEFVYPY
jgi:hypothetical protein